MATLKLFELEGSSLFYYFYTLIKKEIRHKMNSGQKYKRLQTNLILEKYENELKIFRGTESYVFTVEF